MHKRDRISRFFYTQNWWRSCVALSGCRWIQGLLELRAPMLDWNRKAMYRIESVEIIHPQNNLMDDRCNKWSSSPRHFIILAEIDRSAGSPHSKHTF